MDPGAQGRAGDARQLMKESLPFPADQPGLAFLQCLPGYLHPRHRHDEIELDLVMRGTATYQVGSRLYRIQRGSALWLFPGQDHNVLEKSDDYTVWIVYWRAGLVRHAVAEDPALSVLGESDPAGWFCRRIREPDLKRLDGLLREIESAASRPLLKSGLAYALNLAWSIFARGAEESPASSLHPAVERAAQLLSQPEEVPIRRLSRLCGLSAARLSTLFARQVGMPLSAYRTQRRLERFLAEHDARAGNLLHSAMKAGFGSYSQFHRVFTRLVGLSPREWEARARDDGAPITRAARGRRS